MRRIYLPNAYTQQRQKEKPAWIYPVRLAMEATYYLHNGESVRWENDPKKQEDILQLTRFSDDVVIITQPQGIDILSLPIPDRFFTRAFDKRYQIYGNYKYHPATHMQVADGCVHGKCVFCVENGKDYRIRPLDHVIKELEICKVMGFREIFDDSATFPTDKWLLEFNSFCPKELSLGCNMRVNDRPVSALYGMASAGFRMVLIGVESANQRTLDKVQKGTHVEDIIPFFKNAADAGLEPHAAVMLGYPWESEEEERRTLELVHFLLRKGYAKTAQASVYSIPGQPKIDRGYTRRIYEAAYSPEFWIRKISDIREWSDFIYLLKGIRKGLIND